MSNTVNSHSPKTSDTKSPANSTNCNGINWIRIGAVNMAIGVGLGAFGAHGLKKFADDYAIAIWHTATLYLLIHAVGLIVVGAISQFDTTTIASRLTKTALLLQAGIVLFSGSLYAIALGAPKWLGAITPIGGISFIIAWLSLAIAIKR